MDRSDLDEFMGQNLCWKIVAEFEQRSRMHMVLFSEEAIEHVEVRAYTENQLVIRAIRAMRRINAEYDEGLGDV